MWITSEKILEESAGIFRELKAVIFLELYCNIKHSLAHTQKLCSQCFCQANCFDVQTVASIKLTTMHNHSLILLALILFLSLADLQHPLTSRSCCCCTSAFKVFAFQVETLEVTLAERRLRGDEHNVLRANRQHKLPMSTITRMMAYRNDCRSRYLEFKCQHSWDR